MLRLLKIHKFEQPLLSVGYIFYEKSRNFVFEKLCFADFLIVWLKLANFLVVPYTSVQYLLPDINCTFLVAIFFSVPR